MGRKKKPYYRIVAVDSRVRRDGKYIEKVGTYNPLTEPADINIDRKVAIKWLERGAIPSLTVKNFLNKTGVLFEFDLRKRGLTDEQIELEYKKWEVIQLERKKKVEAMAAQVKRQEELEKKEKPQVVVEKDEKTSSEETTAEQEPPAEEKVEEEQS